jgi:hypothetical protein
MPAMNLETTKVTCPQAWATVFSRSSFTKDNMQTSDAVVVGNCVRHTREYGSLILAGWIIPITITRMTMLLSIAEPPIRVEWLPLTTDMGKVMKQLMPSAVE